ncbi:tetratricopeptide repeat protein [Candidatus Kapabacteria bacterium]|nr:tetratricopeptide repeat protein [Candidatus Kapabacteria bacterium]
MKYLFLFILSLYLVSASEADIEFSNANNLYKSGNFAEAIDSYIKIKDNGYQSPELYYNLANSYYKLDEIGLSILYYEKALKIHPNDEDILFNLNIAKLKTVDKIDNLPEIFIVKYWKQLVNTATSNTWSYISITIFFIFIISIAIFIFSNSSFYKKLFFAAGLVLLITSVLLSVASFQKLQIERDENSAIIVSPSVYVKSAPSESSTDLLILHEGTKINITTKDGEWRKFSLSDGTEGWVKASYIAII